jgi:hypothetical protein
VHSKSSRYMPLLVTVGQVAVFPYYILWLKQVSLTFTMFAWLFAVHSFAAACGYQYYQKKQRGSIYFIYIAMGAVYFVVSRLNESHELLLYFVLSLQLLLGALQGYFRAWHVHQKSYHLDAVHHYMIVGVTMLGLSFIQILSPGVFILIFGVLLCSIGLWELSNLYVYKKRRE